MLDPLRTDRTNSLLTRRLREQVISPNEEIPNSNVLSRVRQQVRTRLENALMDFQLLDEYSADLWEPKFSDVQHDSEMYNAVVSTLSVLYRAMPDELFHQAIIDAIAVAEQNESILEDKSMVIDGSIYVDVELDKEKLSELKKLYDSGELMSYCDELAGDRGSGHTLYEKIEVGLFYHGLLDESDVQEVTEKPYSEL